MAGQYQLRITIEKVSQGNVSNVNEILQSVGSGATITTSTGALSVESPTETNVIVTDAQVTGLFGYIGLLNAKLSSNAISTAAIETEIATIVAAN
jgi:hypothetical protein